jgi:WD40 repeat protein
LKGHLSGIKQLAVLPDNSLASGSADSTIRIWNFKSGETLDILNGYTFK